MANEKRLIDANALEYEILSWAVCINKPHLLSKDDTVHLIGAAPTVDAVEVVRCKDCKHWHEGTGWCDQHSHYEQDELNEFDRDYFCAYGERKDND